MVRGMNLADVPPTAFRDILEASSELTLLTYRTGGGPVSVIAPALLFEELEIEEVTRHPAEAAHRSVAALLIRRTPERPTKRLQWDYPRQDDFSDRACRDAIICSASAARSSGSVADTWGFSLPWSNHSLSFVTRAAKRSGSRRAKSPQKTPTIEHPFSSVRLSGILGMSPAAKPTTSRRPRQAVDLSAGSV